MTRIGLMFVTIDRPDCALRLIESVHRHHPEIQVYVIEQAHDAGALAERCRALGYHHELAPYDSGVSYCRNLGVTRIREDLFFIADDDFCFEERVRYERIVPLFDQRPDLLMIGGDLDEDDVNGQRPAILLQRGRHILRDRTGRGVLLCSSVFLDTSSFVHDGETLFRCDMVAQWALCRTAIFQNRAIRWDERFKNNGEHVDFFLTVQDRHPDLEILYWEGLRCAHRPTRDEDYARLRMREDWQAVFAGKWHLAYMGNLGGGIRLFREGLEIAHRPDGDRQQVREERLARLQDAIDRQRDTIERQREAIERQRETIERKTDRIRRLEAKIEKR